MADQKISRHFVVYDGDHRLRTELDQACRELDLSRRQLIRRSVRNYVKSQKSA